MLSLFSSVFFCFFFKVLFRLAGEVSTPCHCRRISPTLSEIVPVSFGPVRLRSAPTIHCRCRLLRGKIKIKKTKNNSLTAYFFSSSYTSFHITPTSSYYYSPTPPPTDLLLPSFPHAAFRLPLLLLHLLLLPLLMLFRYYFLDAAVAVAVVAVDAAFAAIFCCCYNYVINYVVISASIAVIML